LLIIITDCKNIANSCLKISIDTNKYIHYNILIDELHHKVSNYIKLSSTTTHYII